MKSARLLDATSAPAAGFAWLRDAVAPASEYGARVFAELRPFVPGEEALARERAQGIAALARAVEPSKLDAAREALRNSPDAAGAIARASMGDALTDPNLLELQRFCDAIARVDTAMGGAMNAIHNEAVGEVSRALETGRSGKFGFYLSDGYDRGLAKARERGGRLQAELDAARGRQFARIARELGREEIPGDEFIVMRADLAGALPAGVRVVREAPTYWLCAIEYDDAALSALARRDQADEETARSEEAVRMRLSHLVRERASGLTAASRGLGEADVAIAAARFAQRWDCVVAEICDEPALAFAGGRFLPLELELEREGRAFTAIDVDLHDVAVLTGPNMGGKSVCLRTCALVALCAALGLPVPARSARTGLFDEIAWLGIGADNDELGGLLSSFAKEVVRLRDVLARSTPRLLALVDEFARTTTPHEGKALLLALIERLESRRACGLIATHLAGVASEAGVRHFAVRGLRGLVERPKTGDLHEALAVLAESMDYTIAEVTEGDAPGSDAIALAALLGLDGAFVEDAYARLGSQPSARNV